MMQSVFILIKIPEKSLVSWRILIPKGVLIMKKLFLWKFLRVALFTINTQGFGGTQFFPHGAARLSPILYEHLPLGIHLLLVPALLGQLVKWYVCHSSNFSFFSSLLLPFPLSSRNLLHHFTVHMRGWNQLWALPLSSLPVRTSRRHQPWLWLVHVLCVGWPGPHSYLWLLLHSGPICPTCPQDQLPQI